MADTDWKQQTLLQIMSQDGGINWSAEAITYFLERARHYEAAQPIITRLGRLAAVTSVPEPAVIGTC